MWDIYIYIYICIHTHIHKILLSHKKEWNNAICSNMDATRDYHSKWSKSERERQTPNDTITYMWNLRYDANSIISFFFMAEKYSTVYMYHIFYPFICRWTFGLFKVFIQFIITLTLFWFPSHKACGIRTPQPGIRPSPFLHQKVKSNH